MLRALAVLLLCQLAGEAAAHGLGLPVPGPVVGLVLLAVGLGIAARLGSLSAEAIETSEIGRLASVLVGSLGILFVPAGVGVVQHLELLGEHGPALVVALIGSTVLTLIVTVWVFLTVARSLRQER